MDIRLFPKEVQERINKIVTQGYMRKLAADEKKQSSERYYIKNEVITDVEANTRKI